MINLFDSRITITTPFPRIELPSVYCWLDRIWESVADDDVPHNLDEWMDLKAELAVRRETTTWGIFKEGELTGYLEAITWKSESAGVNPALQSVAQAQVVIKRDLWGLKRGAGVALNLGLQAIFKLDVETVFFPIFANNQNLKKLFYAVGMRNMGLITPRYQNGEPVKTEMCSVSLPEWEAHNAEFLAAQEAEAKSTDNANAVIGANP